MHYLIIIGFIEIGDSYSVFTKGNSWHRFKCHRIVGLAERNRLRDLYGDTLVVVAEGDDLKWFGNMRSAEDIHKDMSKRETLPLCYRKLSILSQYGLE